MKINEHRIALSYQMVNKYIYKIIINQKRLLRQT